MYKRRMGGRRFRARRRFSPMRMARKMTHTHYVDVQPTTVAGGADVTITLLEANDSPDYSTVTNGTTYAQCENRDIIKGTNLNLILSPNGAGYQSWVGVWVFRDHRQQITDPTDMNQFNLSPNIPTSGLNYRANTCFWKRVQFTSNRDKVELKLPIPRRLRIPGPDTRYKVFIQNENGNTLAYSLTGRIYTQPC